MRSLKDFFKVISLVVAHLLLNAQIEMATQLYLFRWLWNIFNALPRYISKYNTAMFLIFLRRSSPNASIHRSNIYVLKNSEAFTYLYEAYEAYESYSEHKYSDCHIKNKPPKKMLNLSHFRINKLVDLSFNFIYFY